MSLQHGHEKAVSSFKTRKGAAVWVLPDQRARAAPLGFLRGFRLLQIHPEPETGLD